MTANDVITVYQGLENEGVNIWLDGGWGVDALFEEQSRLHDDVDIVVQEKDVPLLRRYLSGQGYNDVPRDDTRTWNFVLGDKRGKFIDIHVVVFDEHGDGIYGPPERHIMYPAYAFLGEGKINGVKVRCLSAQYQMESHSGYELRDKDYKDVFALSRKFNLKPPHEYTRSSND